VKIDGLVSEAKIFQTMLTDRRVPMEKNGIEKTKREISKKLKIDEQENGQSIFSKKKINLILYFQNNI
jgi:hypothetical protein